MKKYLLSPLLVLSIGASAQKINLAKGKQITITSTANQEMKMTGMGMEMKNNNASTVVLEVKDSDSDKYNTTYKVIKISMSMDGMGQQMSYDSDKPADKDSEIGKSVSGKIGKEFKVTINKNTGKSEVHKDKDDKPEPGEAEADNPLKGLMEGFGATDEGAVVETAFFILPAGKKVGDVWTDSVINKQMKEVKTYTLKSLKGSEAIISLFSNMDGTNTVDAQGMQMDVNISVKTEGEMIVDVKNSLVKKRTSVSDITGNIDMMGQSMPIISKLTSISEYK